MVKSLIMESSGKKYVLLDCRFKEEFDGRVARALKRGHIPSAINIDWSLNIDKEKNGRFKSTSDLAETYSLIPKTDEVITYCQGRLQGCKYIRRAEDVGIRKSEDVSRIVGRVG